MGQGQLIPIPPVEYLYVGHIEESVCWVFLVIDILFYLALYFYLDSVMPNEYGIQRHPCFCFRK